MAKKKIDWKLLAIGAVVSATAVLGAFAIFNKNSDEPKTETLNFNDYAIHTYESGYKVYSDDGITTKKFYEISQLKSIVVENKDCAYSLVFFDEDEEFISETELLTADYDKLDVAVPEEAKYFKAEIVDSTDPDITYFEKGRLADGVAITIYEKAQTETEEETEEETDPGTEAAA